MSIHMCSPAELHVHARLFTLSCRQWEGWNPIKYFFLSPLPRQEEIGEGGTLGRIIVGWFNLMKWWAGARSVNIIAPAPVCQDAASFWYCKEAEDRGSVSGDTTFRFGEYSPESPIPFWTGIHTDFGVLHSTLLGYHCVSSRGRADMIPKLPKHFHKLKSTSSENYYKLVTVWPGCLFPGTTDRSYIWK